MRWPPKITALGLPTSLVIATLSLLALVRAFGAELIVAPRQSPHSLGDARWYVFSQDSDCTSGLREARRRARRNGIVPSSVSLVLLGGTRDVPPDSSVPRVTGWRHRALLWILWSRGAQRTPLLLRYPHWYSLGSIEHLSPDPAAILDDASPRRTNTRPIRSASREGSR